MKDQQAFVFIPVDTVNTEQQFKKAVKGMNTTKSIACKASNINSVQQSDETVSIQIALSIFTCKLYVSSLKFYETITGINISLHRKTGIKYRQEDNPTVPQAQKYHNRYITILDTNSNDNSRSKREAKHAVRHNIDDIEYQYTFKPNPVLRS